MTFIGLHLPPYIADNAVGMTFFGTPDFAAGAGRLGDRPGRPVQYRRRADLGLARRPVSEKGHAGAALCAAGGGVRRVSDLAAVLGFGAAVRGLARVSVARHGAADSGLVGYMFGPTHMSMLWGIVFFSHQLGSFFGGWGAGRLYDVQGNYDAMWWISVGLGVLAALLHWQIRERPAPRHRDGAGMTDQARAQPGSRSRAGVRRSTASRLLWIAGLAAAALSAAAFVLWTRNGAGILLDMMLALCL